MDHDLLILKSQNRFEGFMVESGAFAGEQNEPIVLENRKYIQRPMVSEYFDVTFGKNLVGVALVDFHDDEVERLCRRSAIDNSIWTEDGTYVILLRERVSNWSVQPGPYLPADFLFCDDEHFGFFITGGLGSDVNAAKDFKRMTADGCFRV